MEIKIEIKSCRDCPHVSNNQQEHDDPFTSHPSTTYWYCNQSKSARESVDIIDENKISENCPLLSS